MAARRSRQFRVSNSTIFLNETIKSKAFFNTIKFWLNIISGTILLVFGWLNFKDFPYMALLDADSFGILLKVSLSLYYLSWVAGMTSDLKDEELIVVIAPNKGKLAWMALGIMFMLGFLFAILCYIEDIKLFSISLLIFFVFDKISNIYLIRHVRPALEESRALFLKENDYLRAFSIKSIEDYLAGPYYNLRFASGMVIIFLMIFISFFEINLPSVGGFQFKPSEVVIILFFIYVLVIESWMWFKRFKRMIYLDIINDLNQENLVLTKNE